MKHLVPCAGLALAACLALGSTAEAATPKKKEVERGVITLPAGYDKKTKRASSVVFRWSTAGGGTHRAHLVTTDLDVISPTRLAAIHARIKSRLASGELEARVQEGFEDDLEGLEDLAGGSSVKVLTDANLVALLGAPGVRPSNSSLASSDADNLVTGIGGGLGLAALYAEAAAVGVSGPTLGGAFVAGYAIGMGTNVLWDATLSLVTGGEVTSLGDAAYEIWCGDGADVGCGADGTTLPPDLDTGTAAGLMHLHLVTGLAGDEVKRQLDGLDIAAGADVGVNRERTDLAAWLAIDARLGGQYLRQIQRGLDARGSQHGIRNGVRTGGGIDPNQIFDYGRITPMPEMVTDVRGVRPR